MNVQMYIDPAWQRKPAKKTRISPEWATEQEVKERFGIEHPGEGDDAAWRKYNRAELVIARERVRDWLIENDMEDAKFSYSRYAGCSCGCSPAFILDRTIRSDGKPVDSVFLR